MQNLKLTVQEAQEMLLMSQSSVYAWIDKGKLQTIDGPSGKIIVISDREAGQIRELNLKSKRNKASKQSNTSMDFQNIPEINSSNLQESIENFQEIHSAIPPATLTNRLITELKELALEAGKFKQLEIIRNEEKENAKYWETKFFETNHALIEKNHEIAALNLQISELKAQLEKNKPKAWFFSKK